MCSLNTKKKNAHPLLICIVAVVCVIVIVAAVIPVIRTSVQTRRANTAYSRALTLAERQAYTQAMDLLEDTASGAAFSPDMEDLYVFCRAKTEYADGDLDAAYQSIRDRTLETDSAVLQAEFAAFQAEVVQAYLDAHPQTPRSEEESEYVPEVPYVGMSESRIHQTALGRADDTVRHNNEVMHGQVYAANLYDFKQDGVTIFTARCVQGVVTEVWDRRDRLTASTDSGSTTAQKRSSSDSSDPFHASQYKDAEDFYYDNYEDFESFDDAEIYWEQNR